MSSNFAQMLPLCGHAFCYCNFHSPFYLPIIYNMNTSYYQLTFHLIDLISFPPLENVNPTRAEIPVCVVY